MIHALVVSVGERMDVVEVVGVVRIVALGLTLVFTLSTATVT